MNALAILFATLLALVASQAEAGALVAEPEPEAVEPRRVFGRCEFVNTLRGYGWAESEIPTWTCIVQHESNFNTDATNTDTGDHGIFQISQIYWCSNSGTPGNGCNIRCSDLHNDDISDDARCAHMIYETAGGFGAWTTYAPYCAGDNSGQVAGC